MKIDLNELYGGYCHFSSEFDEIARELEIKPLRKHLEELVNYHWECINENREHIQNILNGVEDLEVSDECFRYSSEYSNGYDEVIFEPLSEIKKEREIWAREEGTKPHKTWYEIEAEEKKLEDLPF